MDDKDVSLLIWTTTPWTLPFNLAICANPDLEYVEIEDKKTKNRWLMSILMMITRQQVRSCKSKTRTTVWEGMIACALLNHLKYSKQQVENSCQILRSFPGKELEVATQKLMACCFYTFLPPCLLTAPCPSEILQGQRIYSSI